mmetsp:Transcript_55091/g.123685  ORF Transcript_55091/g.123685 Transcript_55091/m.123685 type:complete len:701 (+) Transcript_55091:3-2105(+)
MEEEHMGPDGPQVHPEASDKVLRRVSLRKTIEVALAKTHAKEVVRRACAAKARVPHEVEIGDTVFFYRVWNATRKDKARRAQQGEYLGPATVFGIQHNRIWVQYGGHAFCVAREHVRAAGPEENCLRGGHVKEQLDLFKQMAAAEEYTDLTQQYAEESELQRAAERLRTQVEDELMPEQDPMSAATGELPPSFQEHVNRLQNHGPFSSQLPSGEFVIGRVDAWRIPLLPDGMDPESYPLRSTWGFRNGQWAHLEDRVVWIEVNVMGLNPKVDMLIVSYFPDVPAASMPPEEPTEMRVDDAGSKREEGNEEGSARERSRSPRGRDNEAWVQREMRVDELRIKGIEQRLLEWVEVHRPPKNERHGCGLRSYVFGLYTRQGMGITKQTEQHGPQVLSWLHELTGLLDGPKVYTTLVLNVLEAQPDLAPNVRLHTDKYNHPGALNSIIEFGTYDGGRLWVEGTGQVPCPFDTKLTGKWVNAKRRWKHFDAQAQHCVTSVTCGVRLSLVAASVGRLNQVPERLREELREWGFPAWPEASVMATIRADKPLTKKMEKKMLDKEMIWEEIPECDRPLFTAAHNKEWSQWQETGCVRVLTMEESMQVRATVPRERILPSDMKYRDKNASFRTPQNQLPVRAKARLCVAGQHEPDARRGLSKTDAPTVQRASLMIFLQMVTSMAWLPRTTRDACGHVFVHSGTHGADRG